MRALILGCGYVGSAVALELAARGHQVVAVRRSAASRDEALVRAGVTVWTADITQQESLRQIPPDFDWVVNSVAASGGTPEDYERTYLTGMQNAVSHLAGERLRCFVYTSSTGVYAQDDGSIVDETQTAEPVSSTGKFLRSTERALLEAPGTPGIVLRAAGIYGPGRTYWLRKFLSGELLEDGAKTAWMNMIHRDDLVGIVLAALERGRPGEIYNAVDDEPVTRQELWEWLSVKLGETHLPAPSATTPIRTRRPTNKRVSNRKVREQLGYHFIYPTFREGYTAELARAGKA